MDVGVLQASVEIRIRMKIMCTALLSYMYKYK